MIQQLESEKAEMRIKCAILEKQNEEIIKSYLEAQIKQDHLRKENEVAREQYEEIIQAYVEQQTELTNLGRCQFFGDRSHQSGRVRSLSAAAQETDASEEHGSSFEDDAYQSDDSSAIEFDIGDDYEICGYSHRELVQIKHLVFWPETTTKKDQQNSCQVCMEDFEYGEIVQELKCEHVYHEDCINQWLSTKKRCPLCNLPPL